MTAHALAGTLADDGRRRIFAAIVLGATSATEVAERTGLPARVVLTGVRRLADAGLATGADGALAVDEASLRAAARDSRPAEDAEPGVDPVLRTFLRAGVLVVCRRSRADGGSCWRTSPSGRSNRAPAIRSASSTTRSSRGAPRADRITRRCVGT